MNARLWTVFYITVEPVNQENVTVLLAGVRERENEGERERETEKERCSAVETNQQIITLKILL